MQIYAIRMFNFLRFGEKNNSLVFDLPIQDKRALAKGEITMDQIYDRVMANPIEHIKKVKERGLENIIGICGIVGEDDDRSNGVGKSSILEGICYAHYEKIVRKTANTDKIDKAGLSVVTRMDGKYPKDMTTSYVEELLEENGRIYRLKRGREFTKSHKSSSPMLEFECINKSEIDSLGSHRTGDTNDAISDVITMDYDVFVNSQMFGQNDAGKFLMGTDKTRKEMLISLLKLENVVSGCLEAIREKKNAQEKKVDNIRSNIDLYDKKFRSGFQSYVEFNPEFIKEQVKVYEDMIVKNNSDIAEKEKEAAEIAKKITDLESSDKLTRLEKIKEEGVAVKRDKEAKEKEMNSKVSEWSELRSDTAIKINSKKTDIGSINNKIVYKKNEESEINVSIASITETIEKYGDTTSKSEADKKRKTEIENKIKELVAQRDILKEKISSENTLVNIAETNIRKLSSKLAVAKNSGKFTCPECNSEVTIEHIDSKVKEYEASKKLSETKSFELTIKQHEVEAESAKLYDVFNKIPDWDKIAIKLESLKSDLASKKTLILNIKNSISEYETMIKNSQKEIDELTVKLGEYDAKITEVKSSFAETLKVLSGKLNELKKEYVEADADAKTVLARINELKTKANSLAVSIKNLSEEVGKCRRSKEDFIKTSKEFIEIKRQFTEEIKVMNRYLVLEEIYGLDGIQTRIVKRYLPLLNVHIKEFLDILSDGEITVKMIVNDKQKVDMVISGGTSDSFDMLSGGEKMIIRLATDIGLSLLAFSRTAQKPEIICLDEVLGSLDNSRVNNVFKMLERLQDKFNRILLITHKSEIKEKLSSNIIIEKDIGKNALSRIVRIT